MADYRDLWYRSPDGLRLYARDYPCSKDEGNAGTVLLIRGELSDILSRDCVEAMRARKPDLSVVEIPRRGHAPTLNEPAAREAVDHFLAAL